MKTILFIALLLLFAIPAFGQSDAKTKIEANMLFVRTDIRRALDDTNNSTSDDIQKLLFEPEVWKASFAQSIKVTPADFPANWQNPVKDILEELRGLINDQGKTRAWKQPPFSRPTEETMAKSKFLAYYKGATVLKIGSSYKDWNMFKNSLGIPTNRFIRGLALLKIPNRPYCQAQEWIIRQTYLGGRWSASKVDSFGGGGFFMKCE